MITVAIYSQTWNGTTLGMALPRIRYALCKHGPGHRRACGFAHQLGEVGIPRSPNRLLWIDELPASQGHSGIDYFMGQQYSPAQWARVLQFLGSEPVSQWPMWAKRLAWFLEYGSPQSFVCDGDLGWSLDARTHFGLEVEYSGVFSSNKYPFATAVDPRGMTMEERLHQRMSTGRSVEEYRAKDAWADTGEYASVPYPGQYARQYLRVGSGRKYLHIVTCQDWWWMVAADEVTRVLDCGGWAPPTWFETAGCSRMLHELPVSEILGESESPRGRVYLDGSADEGTGMGEYESPQLTRSMDLLRVYVDGSADQGSGIAAGCLVCGEYISSRASLALRGMTGAEASELLSIILGLLHVRLLSGRYGVYHIMADSQNALEHVFQDKDPVDKSGRDLWPGIILARELLIRLRRTGVAVYGEKVTSRKNLAHVIAYQEQKYRRESGWVVHEDEWPYPLRESFKEVFSAMVWNRTHPHLVAPRFCLSEAVLADLRAIFRDPPDSVLYSTAEGEKKKVV